MEIRHSHTGERLKVEIPIVNHHQKIELQSMVDHSLEKSVHLITQSMDKKVEHFRDVMLVDQEEFPNYLMSEMNSVDYLKKFHKGSGHKMVDQMLHALSMAGCVTPDTKKRVEKVVEDCEGCKLNRKSAPRPKTALPRVFDTNQVISWDLKQVKTKYILWMIDTFSRFAKGVVISNKKAETVVKSMYYDWICVLGFPSSGFWADNGKEFQNKEMSEFI